MMSYSHGMADEAHIASNTISLESEVCCLQSTVGHAHTHADHAPHGHRARAHDEN